MSSYYKKVVGNLRATETARVADIVQIQDNINEGEREYTQDMFGNSFILGSEEDSFKLTATTDYIDQVNYNYDEDKQWISFYGRYFRQTIYITKSSIETITVHMRNTTNIITTIYAEIRDINFNIIKEASAVLSPTPDDSQYNEVTFNFNENHLAPGAYYFVLRPVDISATDLTVNGDETLYDTISSNDFLVKYDFDGEYHRNLTDYGNTDDKEILRGLEASYDGSNYLDAYLLEDQLLEASDFNELDTTDPNYDLFFEETFSSGYTYLVEEAEAIVMGEKVQPIDTHVKINAPSTFGTRTDLVILNKNGQYQVIEGPVCTGVQKYPVDNSGLAIAYITTFKNGEKTSVIEQDDEYESATRTRSVLERLRRVEKKTDYQMKYNSPSRIKYNCEVDPVMFNNGLTEQEKDTEGSYAMRLSFNEDGEQVVSTNESTDLIWSIVKNNYTYTQEETKQTSAYCQVYHVDTSTTKATPKHSKNGLYIAYLSKDNLKSNDDDRTIKNPLKKETLKVTIKKGTSAKHTKTLTTNSNGRAIWNINALGLKKGTYTIETVVPGNKAIKTTLKVHSGKYSATTGHKTMSVTLKDTVKVKVKEQFNDTTITGDDAFDDDNGKINVDTKKGIIELGKVNVSNNAFVSNTPLSPDKKPKFSYKSVTYTVKSDKKAKSEFPVLHLKFDRDTYIKSIRPHVKTFKNMKNFGILLFKNDQVINMKNHKRKTVEKKFTKDTVYTNIYKKTYSLSKVKGDKNGKQTMDGFVTFDVNQPIDAGTYSLLIYGEVKKGKDEGLIYLRQYDVHGNLDDYGIAAKCTGSSNLSTLKMSSSTITSTYWNVKIAQRPDIYYEKGTVISNSKTTSGDIKECRISANTTTPDGCYMHLYVSNDGGEKWTEAPKSGKVSFSSTNNIFRWKMVLESSNGIYTPRLSYDKNKNYAVKFSLNTHTIYIPYEDFGRCYETPIFNANSITRTFVSNHNVVNRFSEWEWARIFMLDEIEKSKIDICFSYVEDDYSTNVSTLKSNWNKKIFFSQIFADLELSDFSSESIDYDNYEGNVEFDEHNFLFKMDSDNVMHNTGGINIAVPTYAGNNYYYGNIASDDNKNDMEKLFIQRTHNDTYQYIGNAYDEPSQFSGEHLTTGPFVAGIYQDINGIPYNDLTASDVTDVNANIIDNKFNNIITGVSFIKGVDIDETKSELSIQLFPYSGTEQSAEQIAEAQKAVDEADAALRSLTETREELEEEKAKLQKDLESASDNNKPNIQSQIDEITTKLTDLTEANLQFALNTAKQNLTTAKAITVGENQRTKFPSKSFNVNVALTLDGTISHEEFEDSDGNKVPDYSIGKSYPIYDELEVNKFHTITINIGDNIEAFKANGIRSIGITVNEEAELQKNEGIGIGTISVSSYSRRPYVPYMYTGMWERLKWEPLQDDAKVYNICTARKTFFYPRKSPDAETESFTSDDLIGIASKCYTKDGTAINATASVKKQVESITRNKNQITLKYQDDDNTYTTTNTGNEVLFKFPANKTGNIFKISTNIPFTIYDLINIEYYIYHEITADTSATADTEPHDNNPIYNNHIYRYDGYISKGEINFKFYTETDITENSIPVETFSLPSWGRVQQNAQVSNKVVNAWFKKRSAATNIRTIVIERKNPTQQQGLDDIGLVLNNMLLYNAETMPALGPQMQMRIYPKEDLSEIQIRKVGCVYRL